MHISKPAPVRPGLEAALRRATAEFAAAPPIERDAILRQQRDGWVAAELSWPRDCPYR